MTEIEIAAAEFGPCPDSFPHKGEYPRYSAAWRRLDEYGRDPAYPGQRAICFPLWWTPLQCFLGLGPANDPATNQDKG